MKLLITGSCGFIGSAFARHALNAGHICSEVDAMLSGSHPANLDGLDVVCHRANILDSQALKRIFNHEKPDALIHFVAESHVDRSIDDPCSFAETNALGSTRLLKASRAWWESMPNTSRDAYRHIQVSTDEVFSQLQKDGDPFDETSPLAPGSPYSVSKAAADLMAMAWRETYGLPTIVTRCSNNYGPRQFPEKLIPKTILSAMAGLPIARYGDGTQIRDWLHVDDHCRAIMGALQFAQHGSDYAIGGGTELSNTKVVHAICELVDEKMKRPSGTSHALVQSAADHPGHDVQYAIDSTKEPSKNKLNNAFLQVVDFERVNLLNCSSYFCSTPKSHRDLGWATRVDFKAGLAQTVQWHLDQPGWISQANHTIGKDSP